MRYLIFSDVHANLEALESVLTDAPPYDAVLCLGDVVGYGPNPNECVERVQQLPGLICLTGNHDWAALGKLDLRTFNDYARAAAEWTSAQLTSPSRAWLEERPPLVQTEYFTLAHASPRDPIWEYMEYTYQGPPNFDAFDGPICFVGHTHVPRIFTAVLDGEHSKAEVRVPDDGEVLNVLDGCRRILNPGGVGQPRDGDPRSAYALWDTEIGQVSFHRVPYNVAATQTKIYSAGLPEILGQRLSFGR